MRLRPTRGHKEVAYSRPSQALMTEGVVKHSLEKNDLAACKILAICPTSKSLALAVPLWQLAPHTQAIRTAPSSH